MQQQHQLMLVMQQHQVLPMLVMQQHQQPLMLQHLLMGILVVMHLVMQQGQLMVDMDIKGRPQVLNEQQFLFIFENINKIN